MNEPADDLDSVIAQASRAFAESEASSRGAPTPGGEPRPPLDDEEVLYCANHPNVETVLRCNRCGKPICARCAVQTPVGYRCRQCVGRQQAVYFTGGAVDYVLGAVLGVVLGGLATLLLSMLGVWFFALILGPTIGVGIAEAVRFVVRRRRSPYLWLATVIGIVVGAAPVLLLSLLAFNVWRLVTLGLFLVLALGAAAARLR